MSRNRDDDHDQGQKQEDGSVANLTRRGHLDDQDRRELKRRGDGQRGRGSALHVRLDPTRAALAVRKHSDGNVVIDVSAVLSAIGEAPTWYEWLEDYEQPDDQLNIADGAALLGMTENALRLRVWRTRKQERWTPFHPSGPSATLVANKRELLAWRETWTGYRRQRRRTPGDLTRPA